LVTTEYSQLIKKAPDIDNTQIETESIKSLAYATTVAKGLRTAAKNMCPSCIELVQKALAEEEPLQQSGKVPVT
jgi:hypothetical protein